ncbi:hypothetical protein C8039_05290 [Halogeometricum sp. wsp3]|nr:hypothetical protein C8039_05290 [Halogeometricum sp. wsp3]
MNYNDAYGLPTVTTRMFNNYGPRQNPRYITGTIITQALERDIVELGKLHPSATCVASVSAFEDFCDESRSVASLGERYVYGSVDTSMRECTETTLEVVANTAIG